MEKTGGNHDVTCILPGRYTLKVIRKDQHQRGAARVRYGSTVFGEPAHHGTRLPFSAVLSGVVKPGQAKSKK